MLKTIEFFLPQILLGIILGGLTSLLGVILVLKKKAFFGVTVSQVISSSVALGLFLGLKNEYLTLGITILILIPMIYLLKLEDSDDTILGIVFVGFTAFTQLLLNMGGNVKNHIMAAYFGDILTSSVKFKIEIISILVLAFSVFAFIYKKMLFLSFDRDEYITRYGNPLKLELLFYVSIITVISITVNLLGSFYSIAHLLIPCFVGLQFARSMKFLLIFSFFFSIFSTGIGFILSLIEINFQNESIFLPTSSTIIFFMCVILLLSIGLKKFIGRRKN
jgi:ABC-type Mn2+/Zn2+ transport system permease subunit